MDPESSRGVVSPIGENNPAAKPPIGVSGLSPSPSITLEQLSPEALEELTFKLQPVVYQKAVEAVMEKLKLDHDLEVAKTIDKLHKNNEQKIRDYLFELEKKEAERRKPLTNQEIQQLLDQDYATFTVKLWIDGKPEEFILQELPKSCEEKFYTMTKEVLKEAVVKFSGESFKMAGDDWWDKIVGLMDVFEPALNLMVNCCVICLNPRGEKDYVTKEWVSANISSNRILNIIKAQVELNKLRDFFSELFRGFLSEGMTNPAFALQSQR